MHTQKSPTMHTQSTHSIGTQAPKWVSGGSITGWSESKGAEHA